jgi:hypothetical protein
LQVNPRHARTHDALADYYEGRGDAHQAARHRQLAGQDRPGPGSAYPEKGP